MSSKIQAQAAKFWQSVVSADTVKAYTNAIDVTWTIIKEAGLLIWLVICFVLVIFDWGYDVSTSAGRKTRAWYDGISKVDSNDIASETGKQLVAASKASLFSTISQARSQLGLPDKPKTEPTSTPKPATTAQASTPKAEPKAPAAVPSSSD